MGIPVLSRSIQSDEGEAFNSQKCQLPVLSANDKIITKPQFVPLVDCSNVSLIFFLTLKILTTKQWLR